MQSLGYISRQWPIMCLLCIIPISPSIKVVPTRNEMIKQLISIEENGFLYNQGSIFPLILVLGHNTVWKRQPKDLNDTKEKCNVL